MIYMYVGLAGALGALSRYVIGFMTNSMWPGIFPIGTLSVNLIGSFMLGWLTHFWFQTDRFSKETKTAIGTGFIGSFTTFSTFSVETVQLIHIGQAGQAILYIVLSIGLGLIASWLGFSVGKRQFLKKYHKREGVL